MIDSDRLGVAAEQRLVGRSGTLRLVRSARSGGRQDEPVDPVRPKRGQSKKRIRGAVDGGHSGISDEAENTGC